MPSRCLDSAESVGIQPAAELGHLPRHGQALHVCCALLPAPRTVCPPCDPRQNARAFNQQLSWDTSLVTDMRYMFRVRSSSRPASPICTHAPSTLRAACAPRSCPYIYMLLAPQSSAHRTPPLRMCPSYASAGSRGGPAHLRKPQPTSNRSPKPIRRMPGT